MKFAVVHNIQNMLEFVCMSVKPTFTLRLKRRISMLKYDIVLASYKIFKDTCQLSVNAYFCKIC